MRLSLKRKRYFSVLMYSLSPRRNASSYYDQRVIYAVGCFVEIEFSLQCMNMQINGIRKQ
jgi:hypothetical protein